MGENLQAHLRAFPEQTCIEGVLAERLGELERGHRPVEQPYGEPFHFGGAFLIFIQWPGLLVGGVWQEVVKELEFRLLVSSLPLVLFHTPPVPALSGMD